MQETTLKEFVELCEKHNEVLLLQGNKIFHFSDGGLKIQNIKKGNISR